VHVVRVAEEVEGGAALGAGFGEDERAVGKVEGGEVVAASEFGTEGAPWRRPAIMRCRTSQ
jgi:hypothetical protein